MISVVYVCGAGNRHNSNKVTSGPRGGQFEMTKPVSGTYDIRWWHYNVPQASF
jgi:hypothetical protein